MARDAGSMWSPLAESGHQGDGIKTKFIVHSTGDRGSATAIYNYFNRPQIVVESTFVVGISPEDATRQLLNSNEVADANLGANVTGISVEVVGQADDPFSEWQISELIRLGRWAMANHPIPAQVCPSATGAGFGWHVMFGAPGPWTPVAKDCPGKTRINQLKTRVFPAIFNGTDDDMFDDNDRQLLRDVQARVRGDVSRNYDILQSIESLAAQVLQAVASLPKGGTVDTGASAAEVAKAVVSEIIADLAD